MKESFNVAAAESDLDLTLEATDDLIISSDRQRTKQIMINLLSNAIKFTERGKVELRAVNRDGCVELSVKDTGIGIKKESMTKLFDAFNRVRGENGLDVEGTGLGLAMVYVWAGHLGRSATGTVCPEWFGERSSRRCPWGLGVRPRRSGRM